MPLVTFTSDFGNGDHYVASVKAALLSKTPNLQVVDLSHEINSFDLAHMAFTINAVFRDFPVGTIHIIGLNDTNKGDDRFLAAVLEEHIFLLPDNGLIGLIGKSQPTAIVKLPSEGNSLFPTRDFLVPAALALLDKSSIEAIGTETSDYQQMISRQVKATRKEIVGHVIRVDHYGNLITNIPKVDFDILSKEKNYKVFAGRESSRIVHQKYQEVDPGELFFVFNSLGLLEIGINQGDAHQLLGLGFDATVTIQFEE